MILTAAFSLIVCLQVFRMVRWAGIQDRRELEIRKLDGMMERTLTTR